MNAPQPKGQICDVCGEDKPKKAFGWRGQTAEEKKTLGLAPTSKVRRSTCLVCETKAEREELAAATHDARTARDRREIEKELARKKLRKEKRQEEALTRREAVRQKLLEDELARKSLLEFLKKFYPKYIAGWVHVDICNRLEKFLRDVQAGKNPRLMLFMPPRHGKSIIASQHFPAWALGQCPDFEIIAASYGSSLPIKFSRHVRGLLRDPKYQKLFPETVLDKENENVEGWSTTEGGGYIPAGVGGGITGKGAHILIIDDPVKDAEEADSAIIREATWDWYGSTAYTRLAPLSGVLVIQTRWHDDDLAGRLIQQMKEAHKEIDAIEKDAIEALDAEREMGEMDELEYTRRLNRIDKDIRSKRYDVDNWEIVNYPAEAVYDEYKTEDDSIVFVDPESGNTVDDVIDFEKAKARLLRKKGDALHSARYPSDRLRKIKNAIQERHWHALYQQNPVPEEGSYFKKEMFRYRRGPVDIGDYPIGIAWDLAIGKKQTNDWTVGVVFALDFDGNIQVIDQLRGRWDTNEIARNIIETYKKYRAMTTQMCMVGIEKGQLELAVRPELNRLEKEKGVYPSYADDLKPLTDKLVRARPLQGYMQAGKVVFADPDLNPWVETLVHEMLRFPSGVHDDCVDALAWGARMVEKHFSIPRRPDMPRRHRRRNRDESMKSVKQRLREALRKQNSGKDPMAA